MGMPVRPLKIAGLIDALVARAKAKIRTTACYLNAHTLNLAARNPALSQALRNSDLLYADGASVVWASRLTGANLPERMTAADYFEQFIGRCAAEGLSVFFLGGAPGVAQKAVTVLQAKYPNLHVAGHSHGFFESTETMSVTNAINTAQPDVLIIGLSTPRQELWLAENGDSISAPVRWCVGAAMDYVAGAERRAPRWLCRMGGEWLFRLIVDPIGKWRRYVIGNPLFVARALIWAATSRSSRKSEGSRPASDAERKPARQGQSPSALGVL